MKGSITNRIFEKYGQKEKKPSRGSIGGHMFKKKNRFTHTTKTSRKEAFKNQIKEVIRKGASNKKNRKNRGRSKTDKSKISSTNRQRLYNICLKFKSVTFLTILTKAPKQEPDSTTG
jgi:hypothetical protein